ncbi:hypothetical protein PAXRUDRAFT_145498 [Paxillus rubicundulus Ve08.2h10]|uniref:Uncharacterized protein n=1 Tax=Paxillus rubicundulus Ve08.2h10 TaxID=930991 RepID=A0A0D0DV44_9AGAM|nr:hypothetical protein PAXRUDRAFT_145498 [Paxillus rubicundulus Ve08.2h10]
MFHCYHITLSSQYCSISGSIGHLTSMAPPASLGPEVFWTLGDQADWEAVLARLTASTGLPLQWVENPKWKKICDCSLTKAKMIYLSTKNPSSEVLMNCFIPDVLDLLKASHANINLHLHLYTIHMHDTSKDPKMAEELLNQMLQAICSIKTEWVMTQITLRQKRYWQCSRALSIVLISHYP